MGASEQFGVRLRREREKRRISLETLAETTKVSVDLWEGLERNDLSRWPSGIFARGFVRDYARVLGLDADAVVDEFCRQFPIADRRTSRIVQAQAELIGHSPEPIALAAEPLPAGRERRKAPRPELPASSAPVIYTPRALAAAFDVACVGTLAMAGTAAFGGGILAWTGGCALVYFTAATVASGATPGVRFVELLRHRAPSLFAPRRPVSVG